MVDRKQREKGRDWETNITFKAMLPVTYFLR
jgi:hypothetical protein